RNVGADAADTSTRIYQTAERQTFHTDSTDVVGLLCLVQARRGGESLLVSAESICNRMRQEAPDLLACLFEPVATDRRGETPVGCDPWFTIPVFSWHTDRLTVMYQRQYIDSAQRFAGAPRLTTKQIEALDYFDRLANDPDLHIRMQLAAGDIQFVYNHALLHDRTGFEDYDEPDRRRHLLRLWLSVPGDRELPDCFAERYGSTAIGDRGGIVTAETRLHAPVDA
ncbi:MAG: TauD/TfdA family dioxygenase, partial [Pseudomonadota bacterium]